MSLASSYQSVCRWTMDAWILLYALYLALLTIFVFASNRPYPERGRSSIPVLALVLTERKYNDKPRSGRRGSPRLG